jgi:hypothetical protein
MSEPRRITEQYRLEKRVSSKDSGSVFRAVDTLSGEIVAVKLINAEDSEEHRVPFESHLAALQGLHHPALPRILDFGLTTAGSFFLITEYLPGVDLSELMEAPPARILALLLQLSDGLEALAAQGLTLGSLSPDNLRVVSGPEGEQVKILGLGGPAFHAENGGANDRRAGLRAFAELSVLALGLPDRKNDTSIFLPLHVAGALMEPERLRELLDAALQGDPGGRFPDWEEVRQALRTALFGVTERPPEAKTLPPAAPDFSAGGTAQIPRKAVWEEVRLGQSASAVPWQEDPGDSTMAIERLGQAPPPPALPPQPGSGTAILSAAPAWTGTAPATPHPAPPHPAPPAIPDLTTRVFRPEELDAPPAAVPPAIPPPASAAPGGGTVRIEIPGRAPGDSGRQGTVRIPLKEIEAPPSAPTLRFPAPAPPPVSDLEDTVARHGATLPFPAAPQVVQPTPPPPPPIPVPATGTVSYAAPAPSPAPPLPPPVPVAAPIPAAAPVAAARRSSGGKGLRLGLLIGVPVTLLLLVVGLVAWLSRRSAEPQPPPPQVQAPPPKPVPKPVPPPPAPKPLNAQILLAEESLNASDLAGAKVALAAILPEQIALFTAEEQERYQRALEALTPLQSQQWDETLTRGLAKGDLRLLRAVAGAPPDAATLTPEQKKGLARARKILDFDTKLSKAQRAKNHPETLRQAGLLLVELPGNTRAGQARTQAADALLAEADTRAGQAEFDAALAALEHLRAGWRDHPGLVERLERVRTEKRADDQMEDALAAAARAERAERPNEGLQALDRVRPNERYAERFQQARERLQAQVVQLDRNPPQIAMTGSLEPSYEKGATVTVSLRVTDDQGVESVEAWVRPEGGRFTKTSVRHVSGADYEIQIGPDLHQNKSFDFYVTANDQSGHAGALGSVQRPQKVKRKKWFDKIRGGGKEEEE